MLLRRYLALGPKAVNLALLVGIFPYILKLLQTHSRDPPSVGVCVGQYYRLRQLLPR